MTPLEEAFHKVLFGAPPVPSFSFDPIIACFQMAVKQAKEEERQALLDALLASRIPKKGKHWNAGFNYAFTTLIGILQDRGQAEYPQVAE
jgi:hypothetical protein